MEQAIDPAALIFRSHYYCDLDDCRPLCHISLMGVFTDRTDLDLEGQIFSCEAGVICVKGVSPGSLFAIVRAKSSAEEIDRLRNFQNACFAG